ncbi:type II secretion system F family protein [Rothia aerolata]|uniref:Type II secretion system protein F n=1 Tax=Rothia aerolata TaxID=1812262 RepID=A0A917IR32_9MICC|nr:type II secretion system F family protein [Rothia aerolata]GGH59424.1 type II secretion system protein F [Rothia aerolata]
MTLVPALLCAAGVYLVWLSFWPSEKKARKPRENKTVAMLRQAEIQKVSPRLFYLLSVVIAGVGGLLVLALTGLTNLALILAVFGFFLPRFLVGQRAKKRQAQVRELWPDAVDHLRSAIRAGLSLPEALMQLQYRGPEQLRPAFEQFSADYRSTGEFVASLNRLKARLADPTADNIVEALKVTREVGGTDLGRLLGTLSEFLRENARTRSELEARQSWTVNAAKLAVVAPWVVLCLMASQPGTVTAYNSFAGLMVMVGGLAVSFIAYRIMLRVGALPEEKRVLV